MTGSETRSAGRNFGRSFILLLSICVAISLSGFVKAAPEYASIMPKASTSLLLDIAKAGERLVVVGEYGHILYSDDAGKSWQQARVPTRQMLTAVYFVNIKQGWAVGHDGLILHTLDGGENWVIQRHGLEEQKRANLALKLSLRERMRSLRAQVDDTDDLQSLQQQIEETEMDLQDIEAVLAEPVFTSPLMDVLFTSTTHGWAAGAFGQFYHTSDGGKTWQNYAERLDNPYDLHLNALAAAKSGELFLVGEAGMAFRSVDGGESWQTGDMPYDGSLFGILSSADGAFQLTFGLRGNMFVSKDLGMSWEEVESGSDFTLFGGFLAQSGEITVVGSGGVVAHASGIDGEFSVFKEENRLGLSSVVQISAQQYLAVGQKGVHLLTPNRLSGRDE